MFVLKYELSYLPSPFYVFQKCFSNSLALYLAVFYSNVLVISYLCSVEVFSHISVFILFLLLCVTADLGCQLGTSVEETPPSARPVDMSVDDYW